MNGNQIILDFIQQQKLSVISTVNDTGEPQSALIGFGESDNFELIFGTYSSSRKYKNLQNNPIVSFVMGGEGTKTVQYEGIAKEVAAESVRVQLDKFWVKTPQAKKFHSNPEQRYFIVKPTWVRYTDVAKDPWEITELNFK